MDISDLGSSCPFCKKSLSPAGTQTQEPVGMLPPEPQGTPPPEPLGMPPPEPLGMPPPEPLGKPPPEPLGMPPPEPLGMPPPEPLGMPPPEPLGTPPPEPLGMPPPEPLGMPPPEPLGMPPPEPLGMPPPEPLGMPPPEPLGMPPPEQLEMPPPEQLEMPSPESLGMPPLETPPPEPPGMSTQVLQGIPPPEPLGMSTPIKSTSALQSDSSVTPSSAWTTPSAPADKGDQSYQPESESTSPPTSDDESETEVTLEGHRFIVFGEKIRELFQRCSKCGAGNLLKTTVRGTCLAVHWTCSTGHHGVWHSQPYSKRMAIGNLLVGCAILFSGGSIDKFIDFAASLNLQFISQSEFFNIQTTYAIPTIHDYYTYQQEMAQDLVRDGAVTIMGDGRCDSPGYCAKYCSYTVMEEKTALILDMKLVQVTETGTSQSMEKEGLQRCLEELDDKGIDIECLATDRHRGIAAMMKKDYKDIKHEFDIFHVSKNVTQKLRTKAQKKTCQPLAEWIKAVSNHLWWSAKTSKGNAQLLIEKWTSLLNHIGNQHQWSGNELFHRCAHLPLSREAERKKKWLEVESPAHKALQEVVMDRILLKDMGHMTGFKHTGKLEVYHNLVLKYASKRIHYQYPAMLARLQLSVIDHNENIGRRQARTSSGDPKRRLDYSKRQKDWVVKNIYEKKDYTFRRKLLEAAEYRRRESNECLGDQVLPKPDLPRNIAPIPRPSKEAAFQRYQTRFEDN
ncbi:uncharacterized protein [Branchiostoma lanceolatum]|uniref:uncharacterized protein isoform X1 n=1 Tax=Branchiostoma lanceolatum TaxID=7740 RepID=UPI003453EDDB